jgi:hypothetical protein
MEDCERPFWEDPREFIIRFNLRYRPNCGEQIWNFVARLGLLAILCGMVGAVICGTGAFIVAGFFAAVIGFVIIMTTPLAYYPAKVVTTDDIQLTPTFNTLPEMYRQDITAAANRSREDEGFIGTGGPAAIVGRIMGVEAVLPGVETAPYSGPALPDYTPPSARNPFMNVLLDDYKYNPQRPDAVSVTEPSVKQTLDDFFRVQWFSDPTDVYGKNQSQRQFVTQPSTSIPNDQGSFADWLYKIPGKTCKEGGRSACTTQGSAGVQYPWMGE